MAKDDADFYGLWPGVEDVVRKLELKAWRNGLLNELLLTLPVEGLWDEALAQGEARLEEVRANSSWRGAQLTIDLGARAVSHEELVELLERLKGQHGLLTVAVVATHGATREAAAALALNAYSLPPEGIIAHGSGPPSADNALYLAHTVRSGQRIVHTGHVIIGGDINAGAEVVATGDILVFGTLRGLAHAGSAGDETARIVAGNMRPQQIRIAGHIARSPEETGSGAPTARRPETARIVKGEIQVFPA